MQNDTNDKDYIKALELSEARLRTILESEPECVKTVDRNCYLLDMNPAGLSMIEAESLEQVLGAEISDLIDPKYHAEYYAGIDQVFQGKTVRQKFELIGLQGTRRWMDQVSVPIRDPNDPEKIIEMLAVTRDISDHVASLNELVLQKKKAEAANLAKSQFLANMSHEIRTPMNGVLGMAEALSMSELSPKQIEMAKIITDSGASLMRIINDILDLSKIEAEMIELEKIHFDINDIVLETKALHELEAQEKGVLLEVEICETAQKIFLGDPVRIRQILGNLVSNAVKFTHNGTVSIRVKAHTVDDRGGTDLHFSVHDDGPGILPDVAASLFTPFTQGDASTTRKHGGTGLGLAISKKLCKLMGGDIHLESTSGKGAEFHFHVHVEAPRKTFTDPTQMPPNLIEAFSKREQALRILVAEDNIANQKVIAIFLGLLGAEVVFSNNGNAAVEAWRTSKFDIILMDIQMPTMCGLEATRQIRQLENEQQNRRVPILAVTANVMTHQINEYIAAGMDGCLAKPINFTDLSRKILGLIAPPTPHQDSISA